MIQGLIHGNILCIHRLCTNKHDIHQKTQVFFQLLTHRGYSPTHLRPIFKHATYKVTSFLTSQQTHNTDSKSHHPKVFLHLQYHPQDPTCKTIQQLRTSIVSRPHGKTPLQDIKNLTGHKTQIDRLTIAYSRPLNLRNKFSIRNINGRGMNVSSYISNT